MAVRKHNGSWWVDFMYNQDRLRRRSPLNTKGGAEAFEARLRQLVAQHGSVSLALDSLAPRTEEKPVSFDEYANGWLVTYVRINNRASEQRAKERTLRLHLLPRFGKHPLPEIRRQQLDEYKAAKLEEGLNPKTINNHLTILGKCLRTAMEDGLLQSMPVIKWLKKKPDEFDFLTPIEGFHLLQDETEPLWTEMARLALRTGMRRGELIALDWSAIDLAHARVTVRASSVEGIMEAPKNNKIRHLPLTEDVLSMLMQRSQRSGPVFPNPAGGLLTKRLMEKGLHGLCRRTGTRLIGWHVLRHSFASQLAMAGVPILTIKELMGHSTIQMTMRYAHLAPSTLAEAVPALLQAEANAIAMNCHPVVTSQLVLASHPYLPSLSMARIPA